MVLKKPGEGIREADPIGIIVLIGALILSVVIVIMLGGAMYRVADSSFLPQETSQGTVAGKSYTGASLIMMSDGNGGLYPITIPESCQVGVLLDNKEFAWMDVGCGFYNTVQKEARVEATFVRGRISGKPRLKYLRKL